MLSRTQKGVKTKEMKLFDRFKKTKGTVVLPDSESTEIIRSEAAVPFVSEPEDAETAYLTDENDNVYIMERFPFMIGRKQDNDLSLPDIAEISGIHAAVCFENGKYYISDQNSTNGTFMEKENCELFYGESRIEKEELHDGCRFYLYRTGFTFHMDRRSSQTLIITSQNADTVMLDDCPEEEECGVYLEAADGLIPLSVFPFTSDGFVIERKTGIKRSFYCICSENELVIEDEKIPAHEEITLFSGCIFMTDGKKYKFIVK